MLKWLTSHQLYYISLNLFTRSGAFQLAALNVFDSSGAPSPATQQRPPSSRSARLQLSPNLSHDLIVWNYIYLILDLLYFIARNVSLGLQLAANSLPGHIRFLILAEVHISLYFLTLLKDLYLLEEKI